MGFFVFLLVNLSDKIENRECYIFENKQIHHLNILGWSSGF